jgi:uncharacterized membrane protein
MAVEKRGIIRVLHSIALAVTTHGPQSAFRAAALVLIVGLSDDWRLLILVLVVLLVLVIVVIIGIARRQSKEGERFDPTGGQAFCRQGPDHLSSPSRCLCEQTEK